MADIVRPKIQKLAGTQDETYGKFLIEPLERGFGATLGSSLRRILLSFVQGLAVTHVKIDGVVHEFGTVAGVREDVMEIILNLKELAFRPLLETEDGEVEDGTTWQVSLEASGEGEVTAADLQTPPDIEVVRPETHIATLTSADARLSMELEVQAGRGYVPAERQEKRSTLGWIPVDSIFGPVAKANFHVEPTRLGHKTDLDRLVLEVWTNGGITASDAISTAARVLDRYLHYFFDIKEREGEELYEERATDQVRNKALEYRVEDLDFSVRTYNCLKKEGINSIAELVDRSETDLMMIRNFGRKSLLEVKQKLAQIGLSLKRAPELDEDLDLGDDDFEVHVALDDDSLE